MRKAVLLVFLYTIIIMSCNGKKDCLENDIELWKETPIWHFARSMEKGDTVQAERILRVESLDVDTRETKFGQTLLFWAVQNGYTDVVEFLLLRGANPNAHDCYGESSLMLDCFLNKDTDITRLLLEFGADPNDCILESEKQMPQSPLYNAASNSLEKVQMLITAGAEVDKSLGIGETALVNATIWNRFDVIWYLLTKGNASSKKAFHVYESGDTLHFIDMVGMNPYEHTPMNEEYVYKIEEYIKAKEK